MLELGAPQKEDHFGLNSVNSVTLLILMLHCTFGYSLKIMDVEMNIDNCFTKTYIT